MKTFLCEVGDKVIEYEASEYNTGRPLSYTNWLTTDPLKHSNEPDPSREDAQTVNTENIKGTGRFTPGLFASYHVYPYYPEFMNYQQEYVATGDPYRAYLNDLFNFHTVPVLVAEFGVPASRGIGHKSFQNYHNTGMAYNQGNNDETEQGIILENMLNDIYDEGYCGALVFTWQDEWFKRTWNTMDLDDPDRRPYWSNPQTNEQGFGLLAFDPGETAGVCYVDGDVSEWNGDTPVYTGTNVTLYVKSDEKYVYLMADTSGFDFSSGTLYIPVDSIQTQGNDAATSESLTFGRYIDFLIKIDGMNNSKILVDAFYDSFYYLYHDSIYTVPVVPSSNSGIFNPMRLCLSAALTIPQMNTVVPFSSVETGKLFYGDGNPAHSDFNSLTDFCFNSLNTKVEIRIPWQLFNVKDPSGRKIMGYLDYTKADPVFPAVSLTNVEGMYFGACIKGVSSSSAVDGLYTWSSWNMPSYHEKLKPSYYILQSAFDRLK